MAIVAAAALIAGCAGTVEPVKPCCYVGAVELTRLTDVVYELDDGGTRAFADVFPDFEPGSGFGRGLPFRSIDIGLVDYDALEQLMPAFDANGDDKLQQPELVVLYLVTLARGVGVPAESVGAGALALSTVDRQGLLALVDRRESSLSSEARQVFDELERIRSLILSNETPFADTDGGPIYRRD